MEALHATSVAPSLSWKDSLKSPSRLNGKRCEQKWEGRFGSGPCMFRFQALKVESRSSISSSPTRDTAQCDSSVGGSGIRHRNLGQNFSGGNHAVAGRASPWTTSDDDEETSYVQPRVKMLQDAVGPNKTLLDAQARVCTGPTQTRPLDEAQAFKVLNTVLQSARGELPDSERVSKAQMGAFFGAMTLRANCFATPTQWSEGERKAMLELWPALCECLPEEVLFLVDPEGTIMGGSSNLGPRFTGNSLSDAQLVSGLRKVMTARHLEKEELPFYSNGFFHFKGPKATSAMPCLRHL